MKSILYIVPYFGKFPDMFPVWLHSCGNNPTVNWLIFTDDHRSFDYPVNVKVVYTTFDDIRERFQRLFSFPINLEKPYKLCDFRITYGAAFVDYIKDYDFWGYCDIDLIWGDIRHFLTDNILSEYDKIGFQGHSTLFKNTPRNNNMFREKIGEESVDEYLQSPNSEFTDENFIIRLYEHKKIPSYKEYTFANLSSFVHNFKLNYIYAKDKAENKRLIFSYENGKLFRLAAVGKDIRRKEYMYVHFLKRDMAVEINGDTDYYLIVPNKLITPPNRAVDAKYIKKADAPHTIRFLIKHFIKNAHKLNFNTIIPILKQKIRGYYSLYVNN